MDYRLMPPRPLSIFQSYRPSATSPTSLSVWRCRILSKVCRDYAYSQIIFRWLSLKSTIEYLGEWEMLYNPDFNCNEFGTIKNAAGSNNFVLSVKMCLERTNAIGIRSKGGRYGGTYAHKDIAYHFGQGFILSAVCIDLEWRCISEEYAKRSFY